MNPDKFLKPVLVIILLLGFTATAGSVRAAGQAEINRQKADIRKMADKTLARLYRVQPSARQAVAKASGQGAALAGAMSISPGVWLYQLTDDGLALELTAKGTKYYKDADLN